MNDDWVCTFHTRIASGRKLEEGESSLNRVCWRCSRFGQTNIATYLKTVLANASDLSDFEGVIQKHFEQYNQENVTHMGNIFAKKKFKKQVSKLADDRRRYMAERMQRKFPSKVDDVGSYESASYSEALMQEEEEEEECSMSSMSETLIML